MFTNLTRWSMPRDYFGAEWPEYYSAGVSQTRDSVELDQSNFAVMLRELGGESETVIVVREGHWAVGWIEWIAIHESDHKALETASKLNKKLDNYPVLDEMDWSDREQEAANDTWKLCYTWQERIAYIQAHRQQFEFHDYRDMLGCVRGDYFAGYASELLCR